MECLVGFTINMMIVAANIMKWKSQKSLPTCDKILSYLAVSRVLYFVIIFIRVFISHFHSWPLQSTFVTLILFIQTIFLLFVSHWIVAILCVFYCVRIVTYNCALCVFLRSRISTLVPWLVTAALLMSFISSLPFGWYGYYFLQNVSNASIGNNTDSGPSIITVINEQSLICAAGSFLPFIIFCGANFLGSGVAAFSTLT
ncbi:hypothetical protein GDO81_028878 [Engystomops pustulosus]|uniref:Taste receptor type 2 member 40 n=1 Tax=Engystomops pustulosus TaxID=76066 RepID=A0AAV6ZPT6_ENGPU|nr:hypothetical protein GDO81_028878 [Engystomops pustulosus]